MNKQLVEDLIKLGVKQGDTLFMHSSLKGLKYNISPKEVLESVIYALGSEGTLLLPAFSYLNVNSIMNEFVIDETTTCIGVIPETFRTQFDVVRSLHPTHSVCAIGKNAKEITKNHHLDTTPVGKNSPISKLSDYDGKILMLGCGLLPSTFMHGVEEIVGVSYCLLPNVEPYYMIDYDKKRYTMIYQRHNFKTHDQRYDRLDQVLDSDTLSVGALLNGTGHLLNVKKAVATAKKVMEQSEFYFVDEIKEIKWERKLDE